jgi:hypothetical protein
MVFLSKPGTGPFQVILWIGIISYFLDLNKWIFQANPADMSYPRTPDTGEVRVVI